jgi:hypothetical protein
MAMTKPKSDRDAHRAASFRKTDVTRAFKAATAAGIANPVVKVDPKTKEITITGGERPAPSSDLDRELADFEAKHGQGSA